MADWKPMMPSVFEQLAQWRRRGVGGKPRVRGGGAQGEEQIFPKFEWPKSGLLFPATRCDATIQHIRKDVAGRVVRTHQAPAKFPELAAGKTIRTHSALRHSISEQASRGVPDRLGMAFSGISAVSTYQAYIDADPVCVRHELELFDEKGRRR